MTEQQNPITPPPDLVEQWYQDGPGDERVLVEYVATQAARWGADQLRAARRPKPPSLKELALDALTHILNHSSTELGANTIRRALETLPDD